MSADFYDHPVTGKLHIRAPAGGGNSVYDGPATADDIRNHPEEHQRYHAAKHAATDAAAREAERVAALVAVDEAVEALKADDAAMHEHLAELEAHQAPAVDTPA